jgi:nitroreductase
MQTWAAIESRRNVREFADRPRRARNLDRILEAAGRAPSARNWQPWDFITVSDRRQLGELAGVAGRLARGERARGDCGDRAGGARRPTARPSPDAASTAQSTTVRQRRPPGALVAHR